MINQAGASITIVSVTARPSSMSSQRLCVSPFSTSFPKPYRMM